MLYVYDYSCPHSHAVFPVDSSLPDKIGVTTEAVTCTAFHAVWKKPETELNIELNWYKPPAVEASSGPITAYILEYGESCSSAPPCSISLSGGVEEHTVTGLKPHTEYYVKVAAVNAAGRGPFCEPLLVRTAPDSECCRVLCNIYCHNLNHIVVCHGWCGTIYQMIHSIIGVVSHS